LISGFNFNAQTRTNMRARTHTHMLAFLGGGCGDSGFLFRWRARCCWLGIVLHSGAMDTRIACCFSNTLHLPIPPHHTLFQFCIAINSRGMDGESSIFQMGRSGFEYSSHISYILITPVVFCILASGYNRLQHLQ